MHRLLTAISITDDMGYCQGMNYVIDFMLKVITDNYILYNEIKFNITYSNDIFINLLV